MYYRNFLVRKLEIGYTTILYQNFYIQFQFEPLGLETQLTGYFNSMQRKCALVSLKWRPNHFLLH